MIHEQLEADLETQWQAFKRDIKETIASAEPVVEIGENDVSRVFNGNEQGNGLHLSCPVCGSAWLHVKSAYARTGGDEGGAGYRGVKTRGQSGERRDALCIGVEGECGHDFNIVLQQHKGNEFLRVEILLRDLVTYAKHKGVVK